MRANFPNQFVLRHHTLIEQTPPAWPLRGLSRSAPWPVSARVCELSDHVLSLIVFLDYVLVSPIGVVDYVRMVLSLAALTCCLSGLPFSFHH